MDETTIFPLPVLERDAAWQELALAGAETEVQLNLASSTNRPTGLFIAEA